MKYTIYQLPVEHNNCFMNYNFATKHGGVDFPAYVSKYTGQVAGQTAGDVLEKLYIMFNVNHPADYKGRSLSVSDLIILEDVGIFFCDSFGWKEIK